jgi:agmatinase
MSNDLIYLTLDIDGLDISLCPNTGTPVPGGLTFDHMLNLLKKIKVYNKKIIGADICETAGSPIDSIVSIRLLYKILGLIR